MLFCLSISKPLPIAGLVDVAGRYWQRAGRRFASVHRGLAVAPCSYPVAVAALLVAAPSVAPESSGGG